MFLRPGVTDFMRKILITNDDGIEAGGIIRLAEAAREYGEVWVVAPLHQRSAASQSITLREPIDVYPHDFPVSGVRSFACSGTPSDCVRVGSLSVMPYKPDIVLSGINFGHNVATDLQYSATAGAAFESAFQGYTAIALSEDMNGCHEVTDECLTDILDEFIDIKLPYGTILNVNFPGCEFAEYKGILRDRVTSHDSYYHDRYKAIEALENGGMRYMVDGVLNKIAEPGTDFEAVLNNYISVGIVRNVG